MRRYETTRRVPYTPRQMYDLVADVERYPEFLPLCEGLRVLERKTDLAPPELIAEMTVGYQAIRESFRCRVILEADVPRVRVAYLTGPFRQLDNTWSFEEVAGGTVVGFRIAYEFKSMLLQMIAGAVFDKAFSKYAEAFEARARKVYGAAA